MVQLPRDQSERWRAHDLAVVEHWAIHELGGLMKGRGMPQPVNVLPSAGRIVQGHPTRDPLQREPLDHTWQPQAMVAMQVGDGAPGAPRHIAILRLGARQG